MQDKQPTSLVYAPALFLVLWSGGYVWAKFGLQYAEPLTFLALRFGIVVVIMALAYLVIRPPLPSSKEEWFHLGMVGFMMQTVYFGMCYMSFKSGLAVGTMALLLSLQPILVGLIAPLWVGEKVGWKKWCGLLLGLLGAAIVIVARLDVSSPTLAGFVYGFFALFGITVSSLWEKRFGISHHPVTSNLVGFTAGLVGIVPFMLFFETMHIEWNWQFAGSLTYLVVANSVIAVGLLLAMIRAGDVSKVSTLFFLVPPMAALLAWQVLDEVMPPLAWVGMAVAVFGVYVATRPDKEKTA